MSAPFSFKAFTEKANLSQDSIDVLTKEKIDDEFALSRLTTEGIQSLCLKTGEVLRLEHALDEEFHPETKLKIEPGATAAVQTDSSQTTDNAPIQDAGRTAVLPDAQTP